MIDQENTANPAEEIDLDTHDQEQSTESGKKKKKAGKESDRTHQLEGEVAELKDKFLRLYAEFDNYKKRTVKEKLDLMRTAAQDTLASLLPVLDDFDRAKRIADDPATNEQFSEGVELVYQKLVATLRNLGVHEMDSTGTDFNPELHDAITDIPAPREDLKGKVIDTVAKGYYLHDKIIRHAKVVVGR